MIVGHGMTDTVDVELSRHRSIRALGSAGCTHRAHEHEDRAGGRKVSPLVGGRLPVVERVLVRHLWLGWIWRSFAVVMVVAAWAIMPVVDRTDSFSAFAAFEPPQATEAVASSAAAEVAIPASAMAQNSALPSC